MKAKKAILKKEPQLIEDAKETICIRGSTSSKYVFDAMKDLVSTLLLFIGRK